jgi:hypothetical protein
MKLTYKYLLLLFVAVASAGVFLSCSDDNEGQPSIRYIRITDPTASDSLIVAAGQGSMIAIIGQNLGGAKELWVNDQQASLSATMVTNTSIIVRVPEQLPEVVTNKIVLIFSDGKSLEYPFILAVSRPVVTAMVSEFVNDGDVAIINGEYLYAPLTVTFTGGVQGEIVSVEEDGSAIEVIVPDGAKSGPVTVATNFGKTESSLHFRDNRAFLNYDNLTASGSWRPGLTASASGIDGNYLVLKGKLGANERTEDYPGGGYESQFWAKANGRPDVQLLPGKPEDYVMKFEIKAVEWYGSYLNICFAPWDQANNQEIWSNLNARAFWGPWDATDSNFATNGWTTAVIPMTEFAYQMGTPSGVVTYTPMKLNPEITSSLSFWLIGSPKAKSTPVELHIDNVRIVPK